MPLFKIQIHVDLDKNFAHIYHEVYKVKVYKYYTAISMFWWGESKEKVEGRLMCFLDENKVNWSGVFIQEAIHRL